MERKTTQPEQQVSHLGMYTTGFVLSILLTATPFVIVMNHLMQGWTLIFTLMGFAVSQLIVQLVFFLHLGRESKPRWNMLMFLFALLVVIIVVAGSLWIMDNLDYNMMPHQMDQYMLEQGQKGF